MLSEHELKKAMLHTIEIADHASTPFASILADKHGNVFLEAVNTSANDGPLAHAEMNLLHRAIELKLPLQDLCLLSTCEPCPMCMGAIVWSKVRHCIYAVSIDQASEYLNQIHIHARDIVKAGFTKVKLTEGLLSKKALLLFEKYG
jgi:tRNA(adenine34) deaminase